MVKRNLGKQFYTEMEIYFMEQNTFLIEKQNIIKLFIQPKQWTSLNRGNFYLKLSESYLLTQWLYLITILMRKR